MAGKGWGGGLGGKEKETMVGGKGAQKGRKKGGCVLQDVSGDCSGKTRREG